MYRFYCSVVFMVDILFDSIKLMICYFYFFVQSSSGGSSLLSDALFEDMAKRAKSQPNVAKKINAVFLFDITKDGKPAAKWSKLLYWWSRSPGQTDTTKWNYYLPMIKFFKWMHVLYIVTMYLAPVIKVHNKLKMFVLCGGGCGG